MWRSSESPVWHAAYEITSSYIHLVWLPLTCSSSEAVLVTTEQSDKTQTQSIQQRYSVCLRELNIYQCQYRPQKSIMAA